MKVTIDMENLETLVQTTMEKNIENIVKEQIEGTVKKVADNLAKKTIEEKVSENFQRFVDEYIENTKIKVGGDYWGDTEEKEYTVEQYIKKELKERLDSKRLRAKKKGHTSSYNDDFENVSFKYREDAREYALENVNLHIQAGQTIGVIGTTGSAKTTLVQLIPRLYDATTGVVRVGGVNVRDYDLSVLRDSVNITLQKNVLFQELCVKI